MRDEIWYWEESKVKVDGEYIEITYGDFLTRDGIIPVARIGKPTDNIFPVEWIIHENVKKRKQIVEECRKEINYYLVEKKEKDAWAYACYHCTTSSNLYSQVHWILNRSGEK